ncbi:retrovirus-related pol polyprotein from transposon TNT 1-94 [Tanacetum coccineum]
MKWVPKVRNENVKKRVSFAIDNASRITNIVQLIVFIVDSGCTKHMTGNLKLLFNFVEKYLGIVHFDNDQFALILGYGDLDEGNITINWVYYVEGLNHYLLSVETTSSTPICLTAKTLTTQAWLWHRTLSHLNFDYINLLLKKDVMIGLPKLKYVKDQLCSSCEVSKAKRCSFKTKVVPSSKGRLNLLHMNLWGPMRVASINGKKYNLTYHVFFKEEGIEHQTSTPRTPKQNGIVERRNRTLVEAARTMLLASKPPLFDEIKEMSETSIANDTSGLVPQQQKASDYDNSKPTPRLQNISPLADRTAPSQQQFDLFFGPLYDEFFNACTSSVNKSSSPTDNSKQQDILPTMNNPSSIEPKTPSTNVHAEENNNNQAEDTQVQQDELMCVLQALNL